MSKFLLLIKNLDTLLNHEVTLILSLRGFFILFAKKTKHELSTVRKNEF